jgi:uncharacterized protein (DUF885 family)
MHKTRKFKMHTEWSSPPERKKMLNRRDLLISGASFFVLTVTAGAETPSDAEAGLIKVFNNIFTTKLDESPELATSLGLDKGARSGDKARLRMASPADVQRRKQQNAADLLLLRGIDRQALTGTAVINYDSVLYDLESKDRFNRDFAYGDGSSPYVLSQLNGAYQEVPDFLDSQHIIDTRADCEGYVARLQEFARLMDQEIERVRHDVGLGVIPPDFCISAAINQMKASQVPAARSRLVSSLVNRAKAKGIDGDWQSQATRTYEQCVLPALNRQIALMESLRSRATHDAGVWKLPDGGSYYSAALQDQTTTNLRPADVHRLGLDITAQLTARAEELFKKLGMSQGTVAQRYAVFFKDSRYLYPNTDAGRNKEIASLNALVRDMSARLPQYFSILPKTPLEIRRIPAATEQSASTHYAGGSLDGKRPGIYWLNLRDTAEMPFWLMPTITFHEGIPGHHLQLTLQKQANLPLIRKIEDYSAYAEGWATYAEQLADEIGFYKNHPDWALGYVHEALLRSSRLVIDTGLHELRWNREKAIQTLVTSCGDPASYAQQEIDRYCVEVAQACSYTVGKTTILDLRAKMEASLGPRFDIRQFHDTVLSVGSLPLTVLGTVVDRATAAYVKAGNGSG